MNSAQTQTPIARLPMLIGGLACACLLGAAVGFFATGLLGQAEGAHANASESATFGVLPVAVGSLLGLLILSPAGMRTRARLGLGVMVSSGARLIFALGLGVVMYMVMKPDPTGFFASLLTAGLLALVAESVWAIHALRSGATSGAGSA